MGCCKKFSNSSLSYIKEALGTQNVENKSVFVSYGALKQFNGYQ